MHGPINVKSPNNTSKWQVGFNSGFKGLMQGTMNIKCYLFFKKRNSIISAEFLFVRDNFKTATAVSMISTRLPHKS